MKLKLNMDISLFAKVLLGLIIITTISYFIIGNLRTKDIQAISLQVSSEDLFHMEFSNESSDWHRVKLLQDSSSKRVNIKKASNPFRGYELKIDEAYYNLIELDNESLIQYSFLKVANMKGLETSYAQVVVLTLNEVKMGHFILEEATNKEIRDSEGNYFTSLNRDTILIREINHRLKVNNLSKLDDYFEEEKLSTYLGYYSLFTRDNDLGLKDLIFRYDNSKKLLYPYITMSTSPKKISTVDNHNLIDFESPLASRVYKDPYLNNLVNMSFLELIEAEDVFKEVKKVVRKYRSLGPSVGAISNIKNRSDLNNQLKDLRENIKFYREKLEGFNLVSDMDMDKRDKDLGYIFVSHLGGFYREPFELTLRTHEGYEIYYTLDGSDPTFNDRLYTGPIKIKNRKYEDDVLTQISTTSMSWVPPIDKVFKGTVIKSKAFYNGEPRGETLTHTYFVDEGIFERYSIPIVSLATDPDNLFGYERGIYVLGEVRDKWLEENPGANITGGSPANFNQRGKEWERPIHIEWYEPDGTLGFSQNLGVRTNGGWSRSFIQKSLRFYARKEYDEKNKIEYDIFPNLTQRIDKNKRIEEFKRIILRNSGHDLYETMFRDPMMHRLVENLSLDTQAYRPVVLFINGEYWGIHNVRERIDKYYFEYHYGIDEEDIVMLENEYAVSLGDREDRQHYINMINYLKEKDIREDDVYSYIKTQIDVENYIDYNVAQIYAANGDWQGNNVKYWRKKTNGYQPTATYGQDGRWRWIFFDLDAGFRRYNHNTLRFATEAGNPTYPNPDWSTFLFRTLLENKDFRNDFINRFADLLNTEFKEDRVITIIDEMQDEVAPHIDEHINRWRGLGGSIEAWENHVDNLRNFARKRQDYVVSHIINHFNLEGTVNISLDTLNRHGGDIRINSIDINSNNYPFEGIYFKGVPIEITAIPKVGYRFDGWEGSYIDKSTTINITPHGDINLRARFVKIN